MIYLFRNFTARLIFPIVIVIAPLLALASDPKIDSLTKALKTVKGDSSKAEIYLALATHTLALDYKQSLENAQQAVSFAKKTSDHALLMRGYKSVASVFFYMGVYDQAITFFELCAKEAALCKDEFERLNSQMNLALIYSALGNYTKAISILETGQPMLEAAYKEAGKTMPIADRISIKLNLAYNYDLLGDYAKVYPLLDDGIQQAKQNPKQLSILAKLLQLKAKVLLHEKKTAEVALLLKEAETILTRLQDQPSLIMLKSLWGKSCEIKSDIPMAVRYYKEGYDGAVEVGSLSMEQHYTEELYELYQAIGQTDSAFKYLNLFNTYQKEANAAKAKEDLLRKELLDDFMKREAALLKEKDSQKNRFVYLLGFGSLLLFLFGGGLFIYREKYKQTSLQKLKLNLEAEKYELEQQRLQAQVLHQEKQLVDFEYRLSKNAILEGLVNGLQKPAVSEPFFDESMATKSEVLQAKRQGKVWEEFEIRFLKTHAGFYDRLLNVHPGLTTNERRLCSFLRLDMTTKEISVITGQSVRAVEIARTRLRKKLNMTQADLSLFDYLSNI